MKHYPLAIAVLIASGLGLSAPVHAQCVECAQQMFQGTLTGNIWYNINQDQIDQTRRRDADNGIYYDANRHLKPDAQSGGDGGSGDIMDLTQDASFSVLNSEYSRRVSTDGKSSAGQWLNDAARSVGRDVGALREEYLRRVESEGRSRADSWYVSQARDISERYVASSAR